MSLLSNSLHNRDLGDQSSMDFITNIPESALQRKEHFKKVQLDNRKNNVLNRKKITVQMN